MRRCLAEAVGTALLVAVVVGSGIMAERLSPEDVGLQLLENAAATADVAAYVPSQVVGGCAGALLANAMFAEPLLQLSTKTRASGALWLAEVVATVGLLLVILGVVCSGRASANPFAGIEPSFVPAFVAFQLVGLVVALVHALYPKAAA